MKSRKVAFYTRVSADTQTETVTLESQIESLLEYAEKRHYTIDERMIFIDNGVSGTTFSRPALDALRDQAMLGVLDEVVILRPDRLAKKYVHQLFLIEEFHRLGVKIAFINREIISTLDDQLLHQLQGSISEYERGKSLKESRRSNKF